MSKLNQLARKFQTKLAQMPNQAIATPNANIAPQGEEEAKLAAAGEAIKSELAGTLGIKNPEDIKFTQLRFVESDGKKSIEWSMTVSPTAAKQFQAGVASQRQSNPSFAVPRYVSQALNQKVPGVPVLPAQAITVG
jgi:hypothetical protein